VQDDAERVIGYASRTQKIYCVTKNELLAVTVFLDHFRPHLLGKPYPVYTDNSALTWIENFKQPEVQITRWLQKLQEYQFTIVHWPDNNADSMSIHSLQVFPADSIPYWQLAQLQDQCTIREGVLLQYQRSLLRAWQKDSTGLATGITHKTGVLQAKNAPPNLTYSRRAS